jgi:hypothetical protein
MVPSPVDVMMGAARELDSVGAFGELDSVGGGVLARMKLELTEGSWIPLHTTGHDKVDQNRPYREGATKPGKARQSPCASLSLCLPTHH